MLFLVCGSKLIRNVVWVTVRAPVRVMVAFAVTVTDTVTVAVTVTVVAHWTSLLVGGPKCSGRILNSDTEFGSDRETGSEHGFY